MNKTQTNSKQNSPNRSPKKQQTVSNENLQAEYFNHVLDLMISCYEPTNYYDFMEFPDVEKKDGNGQESNGKNQDKKHPFNSSVTELRVLKILETRKNLKNTNEEKDNQIINDFNNETNVNFDDLEQALKPEQAERPETPLYVINQRKDAENDVTKHSRPKPISVAEMEKEMKEKLKQSRERGLLRTRQRIKKLMKDPDYELGKKDRYHSSWRGLNPNYVGRMVYKPKDGYPVEKQAKKDVVPAKKISYYPDD